ncbi:hypothetical protein JYB87_10165 [Shewanella avicenniae]|uniref:Uncharacterized protein n=1 Tax=Shewanella avicenniae TaxID=2814294 RepID=A0ABX7QLL2_9GAMM|nr:hypothetical protein [Shewanella avicenniae]QSX32149.1 hypothetical protein JYB87_10165 [Shewanella avicenniae]
MFNIKHSNLVLYQSIFCSVLMAFLFEVLVIFSVVGFPKPFCLYQFWSPTHFSLISPFLLVLALNVIFFSFFIFINLMRLKEQSLVNILILLFGIVFYFILFRALFSLWMSIEVEKGNMSPRAFMLNTGYSLAELDSMWSPKFEHFEHASYCVLKYDKEYNATK